ncbi:MAG TPA: VWA domain-containing protein [Pyrinomonadaceae bacterium]|jgi:VWFA-related protein|nr:VWA domain-containing protein [Pyrinomonadaceae bacterium]
MPAHAPKLCLALLLLLQLAPAPLAQSGRRAPPPPPEKTAPPADAKPNPTPSPEPPANEPDDPDEEAVRVETNLVTVPFIVSDRGGRYVADLKQDELNVSEDGVEQKVSFFAAVNEPFSVVLMMDLSASTTTEKLRLIQDAAVRFTEQLQPGDRVKVISFDDQIRDLCDFTGDRARLASAIRATQPGKGTRLYDAFDVAYRALRRLKGRKAVVMLTDGMDYYSAGRTFDDNRRAVEESDVIVYPVRFDTREETERLARAQAGGGVTIDLGTVLGGRLPGGLPGTVVINPRGGTTTTGGRRPTNDPRDPRDPTRPGGRPSDDPFPDPTSRRPDDPTNGDSISVMLDRLYRLADDYLDMMARVSGGRLLRADNMLALPAAFSQIADELRTQYSLGYYPTNTARDGKLRKIRLRTTRKNVSVRARPGYRARRA